MGCGFTVNGGTLDEAGVGTEAGDVDTDGDLVLDSVDNCPTIANTDQRDWDTDQHGDPCDRCPHLPSADDPDTDLDDVGDACDPRPAAAGDTRVLWLGFYDASEIAGWRNTNGTGDFSVVGGKLVQMNELSGLTLLDSPQDYGDIYFASRMELAQTHGSESNEIGVCGGDIHTAVTQYYCCAFNGKGGSDSVRATSGWQNQGQIESEVAWVGTNTVGSVIDVTGTMTGTQSICTFTQPGVPTLTLSTTRGPLAAGAAVFYTAFAQAKYQYLFVATIGS